VGGSCGIGGESTILRTTDGGERGPTTGKPGNGLSFKLRLPMPIPERLSAMEADSQNDQRRRHLVGLKRAERQNSLWRFIHRHEIMERFPASSWRDGIILRTTDGGNNWVEQTNYSLPQGANASSRVLHRCKHGTIVRNAGIILQPRWRHPVEQSANCHLNFLYGVSFTMRNREQLWVMKIRMQ